MQKLRGADRYGGHGSLSIGLHWLTVAAIIVLPFGRALLGEPQSFSGSSEKLGGDACRFSNALLTDLAQSA
jgi:hypothetical protein